MQSAKWGYSLRLGAALVLLAILVGAPLTYGTLQTSFDFAGAAPSSSGGVLVGQERVQGMVGQNLQLQGQRQGDDDGPTQLLPSVVLLSSAAAVSLALARAARPETEPRAEDADTQDENSPSARTSASREPSSRATPAAAAPRAPRSGRRRRRNWIWPETRNSSAPWYGAGRHSARDATAPSRTSSGCTSGSRSEEVPSALLPRIRGAPQDYVPVASATSRHEAGSSRVPNIPTGRVATEGVATLLQLLRPLRGSSRVPNIPTRGVVALGVATLFLFIALVSPAGALNATFSQSGSPNPINGSPAGFISSMNVSAEAAEWNLTETTRQTNFTHTFGTSTTAAGENAGFEAGTAGQWSGAGWYRQISGSATVGTSTYNQQVLGAGPSGTGAPYNGVYQYNESTNIFSSANCAAADCLTIEVGRHYNSTSTNYPYPVNSTRTWNFSAAVRANYGQDIGNVAGNASFAAAGATFNLTLDNGSIKYLHYYVVALNGVILTNTTADVYLYPFSTSARCPEPTLTLTPCTDTSWAYLNSSNLSRDIELAFDGQPWSLNGFWLNEEYRFTNIRAIRTTVMNYSFDDAWLNDTSPQVQAVFNSTSAAIPGTTVNYLNVSANFSSTARGNYTLEVWDYNTNVFTECWRGLAATPYAFVNATCNLSTTPSNFIASNGNVTLRLNSSRNNTTETAAIDFIQYNVNFTDLWPPNWTGFSKNRTVVHKNETIFFSSNWTDNFLLYGASLETNATTGGLLRNVTFNLSILDRPFGDANFTYGGLSNFSDVRPGVKEWRIYANDTNDTGDPPRKPNNTTGYPFNATSSFELWGWARNTQWFPAPGTVEWGTLLTLDCQATDKDNSSGLAGYRLNFYRYGNWTAAGYLGFGITNSTGNATYTWNTSLEQLGAYTPACALENANTTLYYNASEFNGSSASVTIVDTQAPRWWTPLQNRTAVHPNETVHLSANWTDNFDLNQTWLLTNETGPDVNSTGRDLGLRVDDLTRIGWTAAVVINAGVGLNETTRGYIRDGMNITYYYNSLAANDEFQLDISNIGPFNVNKFESLVFHARPDVSGRHQAKLNFLSGGTSCGFSPAIGLSNPSNTWNRTSFAVGSVGDACDKTSVDEIQIRIDDQDDGTGLVSGNITLDEVLLTNETLANSSANFTWKNVSAWAGTTVQWRIYANDSSDSRNNTTNQTFEVWGWANVTNRTPVASSVLVGSTVRLDCHIRNENNGTGVPGYGATFYRYSNLTGSLGFAAANSTGNATLDWDTTGVALGTYTPACQLESENTTLYYNATGPSVANSSVTLVDTQAPRWTGFDRNRTVVHKNESIFFNSSWTDNLALNASSLEVNATTDQATRNVSFNMSITTTSNTSNYTLDQSQFLNVPTGVKGWRIFMNDTSNQGNNTTGWPYAANTTFELWGWARITRWHPLPSLEVSYGSPVVLDCQATDKDNSSNLQGYGVHFYKYQNLTGLLGYAATNATGNATVTWTTTGEQLGAYSPACHLEGYNTTRYYNASEFNLSSAPLAIFDTQPPRWTGSGANRTIVHKNESILLNSTWTDDFGLNASSLETNATVAGALGNVSFNMSITGTSNTSNFTLDLTPGGAYALGYKRWRIFMNDTNQTPGLNNTTTATFLLYGWANLTNLTPVASVTQGTNVILQCRVRDVHNDTAISGYNVTFFNNTSGVETYLGSNFTNSTGDAIFTFPTEGITGTHYPGCRLTEDNATLHYNYTAPNRSNTTVTIPTPPVITDFSPISTTPENNPGATRAFSIIIDQTADVQWTLNGSAVSPAPDCTSSCTTSGWTNTSAQSGTWNITAFVSNANGNDQQTWTWTVYNPPNITSCVPGGAPCPNGTAVTNNGLDASRTFTINFDQIVNVSWFINGTNITAEHQPQDSDSTDNYINTSLQPGTWNITSLVRNANGSDQQTWLWTVYPPPTITPQTPAADPVDSPNATRLFNITTDQFTNATWYINGTILQTNHTNPPVTTHNYTNTTSRTGTWNITIRVNNSNGTTQRVWNWTVNQSLTVTGSTPGAAPADNANATRAFTVNTNQPANATWYINGTPVQFNATLASSHSYTNTSAASGVWNITTIVNNSNGTVQNTWNWTVGPDINATSPGAAPSDTEGAARTFTAYANQIATFNWYFNGTSLQTNTSVTTATYTNTSASQGTWNLSLYISNSNGSDQFDWTWTVSAVPNVRLIREMTNGTSTNSIFNITLQVVNPANATANLTSLVLNETLPTGWTLINNGTGYNSSPYNITFDLGTLTTDNYTSATYRVQAPSTGGNSLFSANITFEAGGPSQTVQGLYDPWNVTITASRANFDFELDLNRADTTINRTISNNTNQSAQWTITNIGDVPIPDGETLYLRLQYNKTAWSLSSPTCAQCTACEILSIDSTEDALQCTAPNTTTAPGNTLTVNFTINSSLTSYDDTFTSNATYDPPFTTPGATTAVTVPAGEPPVVLVPETAPAPTPEPT
ncbi:MAG: hypothetical protein HY558_00545, partial [Euryarchaeota archaeon]|nr:hypothetical protein [Euryarchaeota archaeon]